MRQISNSVRTEFLPCVSGALLAREERPEEQFRFVGIVRTAPQLQVVGGRRAAGRERLTVMKLQKTAFVATVVSSDEGAPAFVSAPNRPPDARRNVTR